MTVSEVIAVDDVHIAVAIVVNAIAGYFARVGPDVVLLVRMHVVDTGVDDGDNDIA